MPKSKKKKKSATRTTKSQNDSSAVKISDIGSSDPIIARIAMSLTSLTDHTQISQEQKHKIKEWCLYAAINLADACRSAGQISRARIAADSPTKTKRLDSLYKIFSERLQESLKQAKALFDEIDATENEKSLLQHSSEVAASSIAGVLDQTLVDIVNKTFLCIEDAVIRFLRPRFMQQLVLLDIPEKQRNPKAPERFKIFVNPHLPKYVSEEISRHTKIPILGKMSSGGRGKPIYQTDFKGQSMVTVGSSIYYSPNWKTFPDFLNDYMKFCFGREFWLSEVEKPAADRHYILKIATSKFEAEKRFGKTAPDGIMYIDEPTGPMLAYWTLGYDLYTLNHHTTLQKRMLQRLRLPDQNFFGVRYELLVASAFVRAGFEINFCDDGGKEGRQPEFEAVNQKTGERFLVEAKRRNRNRIDAASDWQNTLDLDIDALLRDALNKPHDCPLLVFIDLNLPPMQSGIQHSPIFDKICKVLDSPFCKDEHGRDLFGIVVFTSYPTDYSESSVPHFHFLLALARNPAFTRPSEHSINNLMESLNAYGRIPNWFHE